MRRFLKYTKSTGVAPGIILDEIVTAACSAVLTKKETILEILETNRGFLSIETENHVYIEDGFSSIDVNFNL